MELLQGFPGEALLWPFILLVGLFWGRYQERKKKDRKNRRKGHK